MVRTCVAVAVIALGPVAVTALRGEPLRLELAGGWAIQSSAKVPVDGEVLSRPGADTSGWHRANVPTTVVGALVSDGTFPDPYFGTNLRRLPGTTYGVGKNFSNLEMSSDSPFAVPWWYRTEFTLPREAAGQRLWLRLDGVNYRFDAWLNGRRIADAKDTAGAFRVHELDVTGIAAAGANALALRVSAPSPRDLAITFVDWNPMPPDKVMGVYRPVSLLGSGSITLRHPQVVTRLPSPARAELTVKVFVRNAGREPAEVRVAGRIGEIAFERRVHLAAAESREVSFAPAAFPQLVIRGPRLWWPAQYGTPTLHRLELEAAVAGRVSDRAVTSFGIREFTSELTPEGHRLFKVNGRNILIRGAGYTPELMLRSSPERQEAEIRYVKDMGLNTIRLEGKLEDEHFFDVTDREGLLVMPGWCCCDHWEKWEEWQPGDLPIATASLRDQILRLRGRASVFVWLNGSDNPPPAKVEQAYIGVLSELGFPNPVLSSATDKRAEHSGESGVKMRGPYEWVPPVYWYADTKLGGPHGFATEIGPGPSPPPLESLTRFLPAEALWPIGDSWSYHCGGGPFRDLSLFNAALEARYGPSAGVEDYALKAQVAAYESHRSMFESFGARKYTATGVIQWMLNNAWPSLIWHLYDFYLRPGGSYFGAKKALEPLHVQYSYDDRSVLVVNSGLTERRGLSVTARVVTVDGVLRASRRAVVDVAADGVARALVAPEVEDLPATYFLVLTLEDDGGRIESRNVYWLSSRMETLAWDKSQWYYTPVAQYADLTGLSRLPPAQLRVSATFEAGAPDGRARVLLENRSRAIAFFVHASVRGGPNGEEVLPVLWDDNYVTLLPGESRLLVASYATKGLAERRPAVRVQGWNVESVVAGGP
jgi:exo-1,4-beta-D-glucosaminidase